MSVIPAERLAAVDLYHLLDWIEEGWGDGECWMPVLRDGRVVEVPAHATALRIGRLRRNVETSVGEPHRQRLLDLCRQLNRAYFDELPSWRQTIVALRALVADWDRTRPPLAVCGHEYPSGRRCAIAYRSQTRLAEHRRLVHDDLGSR